MSIRKSPKPRQLLPLRPPEWISYVMILARIFVIFYEVVKTGDVRKWIIELLSRFL